MNQKNNVLTIALVLVTLVLGGFSFYVATKISETQEVEPVRVETKAAEVTYKKELAINIVTPTITPRPTSTIAPTGIISPTKAVSPTPSIKISLTPTGIQLVTTPLITQAGSSNLIAQAMSPTSSPTGTIKVSSVSSTIKPVVKSLPAAGMFNTTLIIFAAAISMIFFSFLL